MTYHYFSSILFFRKKSLGPANPPREDITQNPEYQEVGGIESCLRGCHHQSHSVNKYLVIEDQHGTRIDEEVLCGSDEWALQQSKGC